MAAELIDARSLVPLDLVPIIESVRKTSRLLLVSDACLRGSFLNSIAAEVQLQAFEYLDGPVTVVGAPNWITPCGRTGGGVLPRRPTAILAAVSQLPDPARRVSTIPALIGTLDAKLGVRASDRPAQRPFE